MERGTGEASGKASGEARPRHAMSVDVEDWFQVWALSGVIARDDWDRHALRVEAATDRLLERLSARGALATFFTLGWIAERAPDLVRRIHAQGHEVASHGYDHTKAFDQDEATFRADVTKAKAILEDTVGAPVRGYRAAGFSFDARTPWAHRVLAETGHAYSSSSHPIAHDHYGDPNGPLGPHVAGGIAEIPVSVREVGGKRRTMGGGGWFRAAPLAYSRAQWRALEAEGRRGVFYLHPWEVDPGHPMPRGVPLKSRVRHRLGQSRMLTKWDAMLAGFEWDRMDRVFADVIGQGAAKAAA